MNWVCSTLLFCLPFNPIMDYTNNDEFIDDVIACTTTIRILKNRYTGETGVCSYLHYDKKSGRMSQIDNPFEDNLEGTTGVQL